MLVTGQRDLLQHFGRVIVGLNVAIEQFQIILGQLKTRRLELEVLGFGCVRQQIAEILVPLAAVQALVVRFAKTLRVTGGGQHAIGDINDGFFVIFLEHAVEIPNKQLHTSIITDVKKIIAAKLALVCNAKVILLKIGGRHGKN